MDATPLRLFARVRSLKPGEENVSSSLQIRQKKVIGVGQTCTFSDVFYGEQTAEHVFNKSAKDLVRHCVNGYNVALLVFGETGSERSAFLVGNTSAPVPSSSFIAAVVNSLYSEIGSRARPTPERPAVHGPTECRVSVKVYEVVGHSVRDLIQPSNQPHIANNCMPWSAEVVSLAHQPVSTKEEAMTAVRQAWERRTLSDGTMGETHPSSAQFVEFEVEVKSFHFAQPLSGSFTVVRLPGAEALPSFGQNVPIHSSGSSLVTSVRNLGHYIVQLANGEIPAIKSDDPPLRLAMGRYLAANCLTVVMATLTPHVNGTSTDKVLWYMDHFQKIINHPIQNTPAAKKLFGRISTLLQPLSTGQDSPDSQSTMFSRSRVSYTAGENLREQLQSLASTNAALRAENDRLKLQSVMKVASERRVAAAESHSQVLNPTSARHSESVAILPVSSVRQHSRQHMNTGFTLNMDHLKTLLDREQAISAEVERLRGLVDAVQQENNRLLMENGDLKLDVVSLASCRDALKEEIESLRMECGHLQGKVKERSSSVLQSTGVEEGRNLLVGVQVSRLQQELLVVKKELTRVDSVSKELHSKTKTLSASYRNRLEQYVRDVTAYLKDHPPPAGVQSGEHLITVLDLLDTMLSQMMESHNTELQQSEAEVGALQESSFAMQNEMEQLAGSLKDVYDVVSRMDVQVPQLLLNGIMHAPVAAPHEHARRMGERVTLSCPKPSRAKQDLMKALNKAIAYVPAAMETLHPHMTAELCTLLELLLAVKLSLLQQMVEKEGTHPSRSDAGLQMAQAQLRELRKENLALSVRCTVAETQAKQIRRHLMN